MNHAKICAVVVTVPGDDRASAEALRQAVDELLCRARRVSPDRRFDWAAARVEDPECRG